MERAAPADHSINQLIARRWSPRSFDSGRLVDRVALGSLFEAARWAPSFGNLQPWRFIVGINFDEGHQAVLETLAAGNQRWASKAPVLFIALARTVHLEDGKPHPHGVHDLGLALSNLFLQAVDQGLSCHLMAGFSPEKVVEAFGVPQEYRPMTAGAVGYQGNLEDLPEDLQKREVRPRERLPLDELVFSGVWNKPLGLD